MEKYNIKLNTRKTVWYYVLITSAYTLIPLKFLGIKTIMKITHDDKSIQKLKVNFSTMKVVDV